MNNIVQLAAANLRPNLDQMRQHLYSTYEGLADYSDGLIEIAYNPPGTDAINKAIYFPLSGIEEAIKFATEQNLSGSNLYFGPALRKPGRARTGRSNDGDFYVSNVAWIDVDQNADATWNRIVAANHTPTYAVITGSIPEKRLHGYFQLEKSCTEAETIKTANLALQTAFVTDAVSNPCRILRLAGTISYPKDIKIANGYQVEMTSFHPTTSNHFRIENIRKLAFAQPALPSGGGPNKPATIPSDLQTLIVDGVPEGRRSEQFHRVVACLKVLGYTPDGIERELSKFPNGIAEKYAGRLRKEVERCYLKAESTAANFDNAIDELNKTYAMVLAGSKAVVLQEYPNEDGETDIRLLSTEDFKKWHGNRFVNTKNGLKLLSNVWLSSPKRRQYSGITFSPNSFPENYYNLWRGFAFEPSSAGSCQLLLNHIFNNVCRCDENLYFWVIGWFAQMVQVPEEKIGTALVLRGKQGCGKTIVGSIFGKLFGPHYVQVADSRYIVGRFNSHMSSALFLHCDEGFWAGDKAAEGKLKDLVTGEYQLIEYKGKEPIKVRNLIRLFVTSNHDWVVPAGFEERRFCVLDVNDDHIQDSDYFSALCVEMENGGYEALLYFLQNFNFSNINLRKIPDTAALAEQKVASMSPEEAWWFSCLDAGKILENQEGWPVYVGCRELNEAYIDYADKVRTRHRANSVQLGIILKRLVPGRDRKKRALHRSYFNTTGNRLSRSERDWAYILPDLDACRTAFSKVVGSNIEWGSDE